jgi:hypothetical protein
MAAGPIIVSEPENWVFARSDLATRCPCCDAELLLSVNARATVVAAKAESERA